MTVFREDYKNSTNDEPKVVTIGFDPCTDQYHDQDLASFFKVDGEIITAEIIADQGKKASCIYYPTEDEVLNVIALRKKRNEETQELFKRGEERLAKARQSLEVK